MHRTMKMDDGYMGSGKHLKHAINKYGKEAFTKEVLHIFDTKADMIAKEIEYVTREYCLREDTYNINTGGKGGFDYVRNTPDLEAKRISAVKASKGYLKGNARKAWLYENDPEWRERYSNSVSKGQHKRNLTHDNAFKGKLHTDETKLKMSESSKGMGKGHTNSQYGTMWITNGTENKKIKRVDTIPDGWYKGRITRK